MPTDGIPEGSLASANSVRREYSICYVDTDNRRRVLSAVQSVIGAAGASDFRNGAWILNEPDDGALKELLYGASRISSLVKSRVLAGSG